MCSHYESLKAPIQFKLDFGVDLPEDSMANVWPGYVTSFIRRPLLADAGDEAVPQREALLGMFG